MTEVGGEDGRENKSIVSVRQLVDIDSDNRLEVVVHEDGIRRFVVQRAIQRDLVAASGEDYNNALDLVKKQIHLVDTSLFASLTWLAEQAGFDECKDEMRAFGLQNALDNKTFETNYVLYAFGPETRENGHLFVHFNFEGLQRLVERRKKNSDIVHRISGGDSMSLVDCATEIIRTLYVHECEHLLQHCFLPDQTRLSSRIKKGLIIGERTVRLATLGTMVFLEALSSTTDMKFISQLVVMGIAVANSYLPDNPLVKTAGMIFTPNEIKAYATMFNLPEGELPGLQIKRLSE